MLRALSSSRTSSLNRVSIKNIPYSLNFNGTSTKITGMASPVRTAGQTLTWGGWWKPYPTLGLTQDLCGARTGSGAGDLYNVNLGSSGLWSVNYDTTGSGGVYSSAASAIYGQWHSVIGMYDGTYIYCFVDGVQVAKSASKPSAAISVTNFSIGDRADTSVELAKGNICNVFLTTAVFSAQDRAQFANNVIPPTHSYNGIWLLNEGAGTTAYDSSGNGNNGTITSGVWSSDSPSKLRVASVGRTLAV